MGPPNIEQQRRGQRFGLQQPAAGLALALVLLCWVAEMQSATADLELPQRLEETRNPCFQTNSGSFCLPYAYVVGMPKAGTSALWLKLGNNSLFDLRPRKEYCPPKKPDLSLQDVVEWAASFPGPEELGADRLILSGCIGLNEPELGNSYFRILEQDLGVADYKVLIMFRDYPEWMYAKYNYWCGEQFGDAECSTPGSLRGPKHARNPQHFQSLLMPPNGAPHPQLAYPSFKETAEQLKATVGHRLLVLAQHDLYRSPVQLLQHVEEHLNVSHYEYPKALLSGVINHSNKKGVRATSQALRPGQYSGLQDMLPATRVVLEAAWKDDCLYFKHQWGLCFSSCCIQQEVDDHVRGDLPRVVHQEAGRRTAGTLLQAQALPDSKAGSASTAKKMRRDRKH